MGLIQAAKGAIGGMLGDQWKDFYTVPAGVPATAALFGAVPQGTNAGRGSNTRGSENIISNGSKIVVPEGYGLLLFQDGKITGFTTWTSKPASSDRRRSSSCPHPVSATTTASAPHGSARSARQTS